MKTLRRKYCMFRCLMFVGLFFCTWTAQAEHYTVPLLVPAGTSSEPQGMLRILNDSAESGTVEIYAIDDSGVRSGPATFTLNASAAAEFTATDLQSGSDTLGLTGGIGTDVGDARLEIETDLDIVPLAFVRASDGTLGEMHPMVRGGAADDSDEETGQSDGTNGESGESADESIRYTYDVPIFNPASEATQVSRLRLINPGDSAAAVTINGRDDGGAAATGGDVTLTLAAGGARTLTAQQLEAGDNSDMGGGTDMGGTDMGGDDMVDGAITGQLGAPNSGKWRLTVSSDQPLQVVNIVAATAGYWNNLSTSAITGAAPVGLAAFNERFVGKTVEFRSEGDTVSLAVEAEEQFTETETDDGVSSDSTGSYSYQALGPDTGRLALTHEDGDECVTNLFFASRATGWLVSRCTGTDYPDDGYWLGGSWTLVEPENSVPSFPSDSGPGDQEYTAGTEIDTLTLPEATGGDGVLTYTLTPQIRGLTFDPATRQLSGTPMARANTFNMIYTVTDEDGDADTLNFDIVLLSNRG